jgi:hypothetical protein
LNERWAVIVSDRSEFVIGLVVLGRDFVSNKCPTNFSLSPSFDKLKLVGHQTASGLVSLGDYLVSLFVG